MTADSAVRTILALDIERFGRPDRDDQDRVELRRTLRAVVTQSLAKAGLLADSSTMQSIGDGLLIAIKCIEGSGLVIRAVMDQMVPEFNRHNRKKPKGGPLRLRAVVHFGHMYVDQDGVTGEAVNHAFRLLDSEPLRECLRAAIGPLVLAVSDLAYQQVVRHRHLDLDPATFEPVWVEVKETRGPAWVCAPGEAGVARRAGQLHIDQRSTSDAAPRAAPRGRTFSEEELQRALIRPDDLPDTWWKYQEHKARKFERLTGHTICGEQIVAKPEFMVGVSFLGWPEDPYSRLVKASMSWLGEAPYRLYASVSVLDSGEAVQLLERLTRRSMECTRWDDRQVWNGNFRLLHHQNLRVADGGLRLRLEFRLGRLPNSKYDYAFIRHGRIVALLLHTSTVYPSDRTLVPDLARRVGQRLAAIPP